MYQHLLKKQIAIGYEISIGEEKFNVISQTDTTVTMLAQYNISDTAPYKQTDTQVRIFFSKTVGWEHTPGLKEIDVQTWGGDGKTILNNYVSYLNTEYDVSVTGDLITLSELGELGCTVPTDYAWGSGGWTCTGSEHKDWLINGQYFWTRSVSSINAVWVMLSGGQLGDYDCNGSNGIRPVITISKEKL